MSRLSALLYVCTLLLLLGTNASAGPNILGNNWISCSDNSRIANTTGTVELNSECLYQEITANAGDQLELVCQTRTTNFTSAQLAFSDRNFRVLSSSSDNTNSSRTLRVNAGRAPQNTRFAVATLFSDSRTTMNCTLSDPTAVQAPTTETQTTAGACIDSDNDGYGWNGLATCIPNNNQSVSSERESTTTSEAQCIDSDNDGYGWNGVATCRITDGQNTTTANSNVTSATRTPPGISDLTDLILITGQSNAQGDTTEVSLAVLDAPGNQVFAFTDDDGWQVADLRQHWDGPNETRHPGRNSLIFPNNKPHNNFAIHFGKSLVALDPTRVVGFVLATAPGAGIRQWDRGRSFYNTLSNKAMTALNASNKTSFDGVLWHQGETDFQFNGTSDVTAPAAEKFAPNYYPDRLYSLIRNLRQEPWFSGDKAVFICGETQKTNPNPNEIAPVNRRLMALNNDTDRYTGCVSSNNLQTTDGTHFNAAALREIGQRYASKYLQLKNQ